MEPGRGLRPYLRLGRRCHRSLHRLRGLHRRIGSCLPGWIVWIRRRSVRQPKRRDAAGARRGLERRHLHGRGGRHFQLGDSRHARAEVHPGRGPWPHSHALRHHETQALTANAGAGQFRLAFGIEGDATDSFADLPTEGTGDLTPGSTTITNVNTIKGAFEVGLPVRTVTGVLPEETVITAVGPDTLTVSKPAVKNATGSIYPNVVLKSRATTRLRTFPTTPAPAKSKRRSTRCRRSAPKVARSALRGVPATPAARRPT